MERLKRELARGKIEHNFPRKVLGYSAKDPS